MTDLVLCHCEACRVEVRLGHRVIVCADCAGPTSDVRPQALDSGDQVTILRSGWGGQSGAVLDQQADGTYRLAVTQDMFGLAEGLRREELERLGGELQLRDWVEIRGTAFNPTTDEECDFQGELGLIVDNYEGGDLRVWVQLDTADYRCPPRVLRRVTHAEAMKVFG